MVELTSVPARSRSRVQIGRVVEAAAILGLLALALWLRVPNLDAYTGSDLDRALAVWSRDDEVDEHYNSLFRELLTYMMGDPRTITACAHLLFVAKNLERIGDHATNIAEIIHYEITGEEMISGDRPKTDALRA